MYFVNIKDLGNWKVLQRTLVFVNYTNRREYVESTMTFSL